jgi:hypothetical protein
MITFLWKINQNTKYKCTLQFFLTTRITKPNPTNVKVKEKTEYLSSIRLFIFFFENSVCVGGGGMDLFTRDKISYNDNELSNYWSYTDKQRN